MHQLSSWACGRAKIVHWHVMHRCIPWHGQQPDRLQHASTVACSTDKMSESITTPGSDIHPADVVAAKQQVSDLTTRASNVSSITAVSAPPAADTAPAPAAVPASAKPAGTTIITAPASSATSSPEPQQQQLTDPPASAASASAAAQRPAPTTVDWQARQRQRMVDEILQALDRQAKGGGATAKRNGMRPSTVRQSSEAAASSPK